MGTLFDLTPITGREADENRTVTFARNSFSRRSFIWGAAGAVVGLAASMPLLPLLGMWALVVVPAGVTASLLLFYVRGEETQTTGWQRLLRSARQPNGYLVRCGEPVSLDEPPMRWTMRAWDPIEPDDGADDIDLGLLGVPGADGPRKPVRPLQRLSAPTGPTTVDGTPVDDLFLD